MLGAEKRLSKSYFPHLLSELGLDESQSVDSLYSKVIMTANWIHRFFSF
jgi:hypothetical protein